MAKFQSILKNVSTSYVHTHHGVATSEVDGMDWNVKKQISQQWNIPFPWTKKILICTPETTFAAVIIFSGGNLKLFQQINLQMFDRVLNAGDVKGYFKEFKDQDIWPVGKKYPQEKIFFGFKYPKMITPEGRRGWWGVTLQVPLSSSQCAFYFPKCPFISRIALSFSRSALFFFLELPFCFPEMSVCFSRSDFLFLKNVPLFSRIGH